MDTIIMIGPYRVRYWIEDDSKMDESDIEHVRILIDDGYEEGELCHGENEVRGWWNRIITTTN